MRDRARRLAADERGVSLIELAVFLPVLVFLVMGVTDLAQGLAARLGLEQAAYRALEEAAAGTVQTDYSYLKTEAETAAGAGSTASVDQWLECNGTRQTDFSGSCPNGQMTARYVKVSVSQDFKPTFSYTTTAWHFFHTNANGAITLTGSAAVRVQ